MQYYALCISLDRPYFSRNLLRDPDVTTSAVFNETRNARAHCTSSANAFVKVLRMFREQHTLRQTNVQLVHLVFTTSIIHAYNACLSPSRRPKVADGYDALDDLQICCQALRDVSQSWVSAARALEVIICIKQAWQNKIAAHHATTAKRPPSRSDGLDSTRNRKKTAATANINARSARLPSATSTFSLDSAALPDLAMPVGLDATGASQAAQAEEFSIDSSSWQYLNIPEDGLTGLENIDHEALFRAPGGQDEMMYLMDNFDPLEDLLSLDMTDMPFQS